MGQVPDVLAVIAVLLFMVWWKLDNIDKRLKDRFPTEKEMDYELSQREPMAHWEKHKNDK
jgi:hypothetical protein